MHLQKSLTKSLVGCRLLNNCFSNIQTVCTYSIDTYVSSAVVGLPSAVAVLSGVLEDLVAVACAVFCPMLDCAVVDESASLLFTDDEDES